MTTIKLYLLLINCIQFHFTLYFQVEKNVEDQPNKKYQLTDTI